MRKSPNLRPVDIPVALHLLLCPSKTYGDVAHGLDISTSTAHEAVQRLIYAGLATRTAGDPRSVNVAALLEFLKHGVRYAFPAQRKPQRRGVPTAHAAPALSGHLDPDIEPVVWPSSRGDVVGAAIDPLLAGAAELPLRCPAVYDALTLVDAMRVGTARDRGVAIKLLTERLEAAAHARFTESDQNLKVS